MVKSDGTLSAGVCVVRGPPSLERCLLLRVYGYWDFPKGEVEPPEAPLDAAIREVREETGLSNLVVRSRNLWYETAPYGKGKVARYYLAESAEGDVVLPINPELGAPEHHEFRWCTFDEARTLLNERLKPVSDWAEHALAQ